MEYFNKIRRELPFEPASAKSRQAKRFGVKLRRFFVGACMGVVARGMVVLVAALHVSFLVLEMFLWNGPIGQRVFAMTPQVATQTAVLAANQGLYNGFLAAGLIWGAIANKRDVMIFFLLCAIVAGVFGGLTAKFSIIYTQAAPALVALAAVLLAKTKA